MKLRFEVDQAEAFRQGIDCPKSIVTIDANPADLSPEDRNLIADRLHGIEVCQLWNSGEGTSKMMTEAGKPARIMAKAPSFDSLMDAIRECQERVEKRQERHRAVALTIAERE